MLALQSMGIGVMVVDIEFVISNIERCFAHLYEIFIRFDQPNAMALLRTSKPENCHFNCEPTKKNETLLSIDFVWVSAV